MSRVATVEAYLVDNHSVKINDDAAARRIFTEVSVRYHTLGVTLDLTPDQECQALLLAIRYIDDQDVVRSILNEKIEIDDTVNQKLNAKMFMVMLLITLFAILYCFYVHETHSEPTGLMDLVKSFNSLVNI